MIVALIDNGSLEAAAHRNLRRVASAISAETGINVRAVSWKHSDRIADRELDDTPAWTLAPFLRAMVSLGQREFVFVPFFISAQGAIGSALRADIEGLQAQLGGFDFSFTEGLAARDVIAPIVAERIREAAAARHLVRPPVIVVDHGGPATQSADLRNRIADQVRALLDGEIGPLAAASMEGEEFAHNRPLFAEQFGKRGFDRGDVIVAPLFLSPGRHAGPTGDLAQIARAAEERHAASGLRCHFTELVGTHPRVVDALAAALRYTLSTFYAESLA